MPPPPLNSVPFLKDDEESEADQMTFNLCMAVVSHVLDADSENFHLDHHDDHDDDNGHDDEGGESSLCVWSELEDPDGTYSLLDPDLVVGRHFWGDLGLGNLFDDNGHDDESGESSLCVWSELEDPDATYSLLDPDLVVGRHFWGDLGLGNLFDCLLYTSPSPRD